MINGQLSHGKNVCYIKRYLLKAKVFAISGIRFLNDLLNRAY